jgi:D-tyrosyl-tRNA(Tyr) deacylase|tara:strand:+ start:479 stop:919 length:441 start_codon:yes stop_codon:yes gene_type:complete
LKLVVQRVIKCDLKIDRKIFSSIGYGMVIFIGISKDDDFSLLNKLATKISKLRIFNDEFGKMNKNINEINGEILLVSQFTLCADTKKGNRPSFIGAANPEYAIKIYNSFIGELNKIISTKIQTGKFGADMKINLINDGPVTIILEN